MKSIAKNLKRTAKLLGSKGGMQGKENLDHIYWTVRILVDCTHLLRFDSLVTPIKILISREGGDGGGLMWGKSAGDLGTPHCRGRSVLGPIWLACAPQNALLFLDNPGL